MDQDPEAPVCMDPLNKVCLCILRFSKSILSVYGTCKHFLCCTFVYWGDYTVLSRPTVGVLSQHPPPTPSQGIAQGTTGREKVVRHLQ